MERSREVFSKATCLPLPGALCRCRSPGLLASQRAQRNVRRMQGPAPALLDRESLMLTPGAVVAFLPQDEMRETTFTV